MARFTAKNFYELDKEDRKKYLEEFYQLPFVKGIVAGKDIALIVGFIFLFMSLVVSHFVDFEMVLPFFNDISNFIGICTLLFYVCLEIYLWISFVRWLKIKHKVDY
ncbi:MAG: hypothetical protein IKJ43_02205 [Bacilli bacterium]|nr:hypothetical protein [Bacilli bacterium]